MERKDPRGHAGRGITVPYCNDSATVALSLETQTTEDAEHGA